MTPKQQRIAIAEACGATWVNIPPKPENGFSSEYHPKRLLTFTPADLRILPLADPRTHDSTLVPDYLNDLNAMHEAEKVLTIHQQNAMNDALWDLLKGCKYLWHATAAEHAEAFLRTLNLWKDKA